MTSLPGVVCTEAENPRQIVDSLPGEKIQIFYDFSHFFSKTSVFDAII